ncbi:MAG: right-handed parallel beta-helix repeat-containing protein, partial [Bacteroidales bacterium]|nr:right-handed parallel beta-helix repeat-containing protein [Bacteroidales bacterium]
LALNPNHSGTEKSPVVFRAEEGAHPVFYGGKKIQGFEKVSDKLWRAKIAEVAKYGWSFEQLYVNGKRAVRAKSPNTGFYYLKGSSETILDKGKGGIPNLTVQQLMLFKNGADQVASFEKEDFNNAIMTFYHKWDNTRSEIVGFNQDSSSVFAVGRGMKPWNPLNKMTRYVIENFKTALDTCGEWYLDRTGYLYYMPLQGETINNVEVLAPVTDYFMVIQGDEKTGKKVENIQFIGLSFQVSGYQMPEAGNESAQAASPIDAAIMLDFAGNIQFINCEVAHTGTNAIWFRKGCNDGRVEHCYLHDLGAGGVKIGELSKSPQLEFLTKNMVVDNNIIRSGGYIFPCAVGVTIFHASDNAVTHNEIADFRYSGVSVGWVWGYGFSPSKRNKIEFNHIHHLGWAELCDMGGVYCLGQSEGTTVSNNVIHHVHSFDYGGWGLYTDEGSTGILMENNLVYNCKNSAFHQHYGKENIIRNNIFANNLKSQLQASKIEDHLSFTFTNNIIWYSTGDLLGIRWEKFNIKTDYNCYWDTRTKDIRFAQMSFAEWKKSGKDIHSIVADPQFANPSAFDYTVKNKAVMRKIGFKPFDYSQAGVYGSEEWKKLAEFDQAKAKIYDEAVAENEKISSMILELKQSIWAAKK